MPFNPTYTVLNTVNEYNNLYHKITYTDALGVSYPVTITPVEAVETQVKTADVNGNPVTATGTSTRTIPTLIVSGDTISGYYSDAFDITLQYRNNDDTIGNATRFSQIDTSNLSEMIYYRADQTNRKVFSYIATANGESQTYTINLDNNWDKGRDELLRYIAIAKTTSHPKEYLPPQPSGVEPVYTIYPSGTPFNGISIDWINTSGVTDYWYNNSNKQTFWTNKIV